MGSSVSENYLLSSHASTPAHHSSTVSDDHLQNKDLDAGALFVLQSKGSWIHCGYHLTTSIVAPALLSLPYAFMFLGWTAGILSLVVGAAVSFYSYNLLSMVLDHHAASGHRLLRFRDMAHHILGPNWARYYVGPVQFLVCYLAVIGGSLLGGQCMRTMYKLSNPDGELKLYAFVSIFGAFMLILAQLPSFHSLRHINLISVLLSLAYTACAVGGCIYIGSSSRGPSKDYSLKGDQQTRVFGAFNAMGIIATSFGNGIIPEIQATVAPPTKGKMFKGLCLCYTVLAVTFFSTAIAGYWAFGNQARGVILNNFMDSHGTPLLPKSFIYLSNILVIAQLSAVTVVYLQPTNEILEKTFGDPESKQFSLRNILPRVVARSVSVIAATVVATMLPFIGDIVALTGAIGFLPLDFMLPAVFYNVTFKPSRRGFVFLLNGTIAVVFAALTVITTIAAVRQIGLDAKYYKLFANV
uniref:Amino acid transporter transmembrane domain-containing protein n=1 Tax=Kalanchoe fedtschenkoi TaxID=63787 RepID=A0A7N0SVY3_KALFE